MSCAINAPGPDEPFTVERLTARTWYHIYCTEVHPNNATSFNRGWGQTRFAPIRQADGAQVHTYYAASTIRCAMLESVLHDVSLDPPGVFEVDRLPDFHLVTLALDVDIDAVTFHTPFLPQLKLSRTMLIESHAACYPQTAAWAEAAFRQRPGAAAIKYGSRRDDEGNCIMLYEQRIPPVPFRVIDDRPLSSPDLRKQFLGLVRQLGIAEI
jgi:hypothetical protein